MTAPLLLAALLAAAPQAKAPPVMNVTCAYDGIAEAQRATVIGLYAPEGPDAKTTKQQLSRDNRQIDRILSQGANTCPSAIKRDRTAFSMARTYAIMHLRMEAADLGLSRRGKGGEVINQIWSAQSDDTQRRLMRLAFEETEPNRQFIALVAEDVRDKLDSEDAELLSIGVLGVYFRASVEFINFVSEAGYENFDPNDIAPPTKPDSGKSPGAPPPDAAPRRPREPVGPVA